MITPERLDDAERRMDRLEERFAEIESMARKAIALMEQRKAAGE